MKGVKGAQRGFPLWWGYGGIPHKNISGRVGGKSQVCIKYDNEFAMKWSKLLAITNRTHDENA
jgi:hypothetical protein